MFTNYYKLIFALASVSLKTGVVNHALLKEIVSHNSLPPVKF